MIDIRFIIFGLIFIAAMVAVNSLAERKVQKDEEEANNRAQ